MSNTAKSRKGFVEAVFKHLWMAGEVSTEERESTLENFEKTPYFGNC